MKLLSTFIMIGLVCMQFVSGKVIISDIFNNNVKVNEEAFYNFQQLVETKNYPYEEHFVTTDDGYILTLHRIQEKNTKIKSNLKPVLLNHGLLDSSDSFVFNTEQQSPGFILANAGFDVWFINNRGNKYSLNHTDMKKYNPHETNSLFWDFSWQEMSLFDLPASLNYITSLIKQKINFIGHSQGTTIMFAALARRDNVVLEYVNNIIMLAPTVYLKHANSPMVNLFDYDYILDLFSNFTDNKKIGHLNSITKKMSVYLCTHFLQVCIRRVQLISDLNISLDNVKQFKITTGHFPAGTSLQNIQYWSQMIKNEDFRMFDYGENTNIFVYGTTYPPLYKLDSITEPIHFFVGKSDRLSSIEDTSILKRDLNNSKNVQYNIYSLGHGTFLWGLDVKTYMNDVIKIML